MNVVLIGKGKWGTLIFSKLSQFPSINITVYGRDFDGNKLKSGVIDWFIIATPDSTHCSIIREIVRCCLPPPKGILCEKPLSFSYAECLEMYDLVERNGICLYVSNIYIFLPFPVVVTSRQFRIYRTNGSRFKNIVEYISMLVHDIYLWYVNYPTEELMVRNFSYDKYTFHLELSHHVTITYHTDRKSKVHTWNQIYLSDSGQDILSAMLEFVLLNVNITSVSLARNKDLTLKTMKFITSLLKQIELSPIKK